jgi:hypothetical protein
MKKFLTYSVVAATIAWSMGISAVLPAAAAYSTTDGDLVKVTSGCPAGANCAGVYYISGGKKYLFVNRVTYTTWASAIGDPLNKFTGLKGITQADFEAITLGGNITARPGVDLIKFDNSSIVYAVATGANLCRLTDTATQTALYGNETPIVIQAAFESGYNKDATCVLTSTSKYPDGTLIKASTGDTYLLSNGNKRAISTDAFTANGYNASNVRTVSDLTIYGTGTALTAKETALSSPVVGSSSTPVVVGGNLSVSLSSATPAAAVIPDGSAYVKMLTVNLAAASADVSVTGVTITKTGFVSNTHVNGVSVWDADGNKHGDVMTSINSNNQVVIGFGSYPIAVSAGSSKTLTIAYNISGDALAGTVGATISGLTTNGTVSGLPIAGATMSITDGSSSLSAVKVEQVGVGGNTASTDSANVEIGETKEISKVKFTETTGRNDVTLDKVTFYLEGTAKDQDIKDFTLVAPDNTVLGTKQYADGRYVTITLSSGYTIPKGLNRTLTLKGTIANGSGNYFRMNVQSEYDVMVKDSSNGYYIMPTDSDGGAWTSVVSTNGYFKMKSGSLNITKTSGSPSGNVSAGTSDQVLAKFDITAVGEDMEIRKIGLKIATTTANLDLSGNVKLVMDGSTLLTFSGDYDAEVYGAGEQKSLSSYYTIKSGETKVLEVIGNIDSQATTETYQVSIGNFYVRRLSTLDYADNIPSASYTSASGNQLSVETTGLTLSKDTSYADSTVAKGALQKIGQFIFQAGNAEGVCVTNATIKLEGSYDSSNTFTYMELWNGTTQLGSRINSVSTSSNSFSFNLCMDANQSKTVEVKAYVRSSAGDVNGNVDFDSYSYMGRATSNTTSLTGQNKNGQTITLGSANLVVSAVNDATTISSIRLAGKTGQQLAKWKFESQNDQITVGKLAIFTRKELGTNKTDSGNLGTLYLYDSSNMSTPLGTANYVSGVIQFSGLNWTIGSNSIKYLILKSDTNSVIDVASKLAFVIQTNNDSSKFEAKDSAGNILANTQIDNGTAGTNATATYFATSTFSLFQNAAPEVSEYTFGTTLNLGTQAKLIRFKVVNNGNRDLRLATTTLSIAASGLATGDLRTFKLWEANANGEPGTLLATYVDNASTGRVTSTRTSLDVAFGEGNDSNSLFNSLTVSSGGGSRTFILTADTSNTLTGVSAGGRVNVSVSLNGSTGYSETAGADGDTYWGDGNMLYYYTPSNGSENATAYTSSDSYSVIGTTVTASN